MLIKPAVIEPVNPFEGGNFDLVDGPPWTLSLDQLSFVEPVDGLRESIVATIPGGPDRGIDSSLDKSLGESDGRVLRATVVVKPNSV